MSTCPAEEAEIFACSQLPGEGLPLSPGLAAAHSTAASLGTQPAQLDEPYLLTAAVKYLVSTNCS
jgi:hypothetical protein